MEPLGMLRRLLGLAPFLEHQWRHPFELGILLGRADIAGKLEAVTIGIKEIDRTEDAMIGRPEHVDALCLNMCLGSGQGVHVGDLERNVLHPFGRIGVSRHLWLVGKLEKGEDIASAAVEEHMHVRVVGAGRRDMILGEGIGVAHAEHALVPGDSLTSILAAIGGVMDAVEGKGMAHAASVTPGCRIIQTAVWETGPGNALSEARPSELVS